MRAQKSRSWNPQSRIFEDLSFYYIPPKNGRQILQREFSAGRPYTEYISRKKEMVKIPRVRAARILSAVAQRERINMYINTPRQLQPNQDPTLTVGGGRGQTEGKGFARTN